MLCEELNHRGSSGEHAKSGHTTTPKHHLSLFSQKVTEGSGLAHRRLQNLKDFSKFTFTRMNLKSMNFLVWKNSHSRTEQQPGKNSIIEHDSKENKASWYWQQHI